MLEFLGTATSRMAGKSVIHRYPDPGETLGEVIFGPVMVLTFTTGAGLLTTEAELNTHELVTAHFRQPVPETKTEKK
jgi:hypothetical protein